MAMVPKMRIEQVSRNARTMRRPQHTFSLVHRPWEIRPMVIAPVLPGETLRNLLHQSRVVTDPIRNKLVGWWCEYYYFYIPHRALREKEDHTLSTGQTEGNLTDARQQDIQKMHLNPEYDLLSDISTSSANDHLYMAGDVEPVVPWVTMCLNKVVAQYFRDADELVNNNSAEFGTAMYIARAVPSRTNWMDSLLNAAEYAAFDTTVDITAGTPDTLSMSALEQAMRMYDWLKDQNFVEMTFEDFLRTHGVSLPAPNESEPELLRYDRSWSYPSNTVDPDDGSVASAVSWSPAFRADKDRFFREPGFIFGVSVVRPKVYLANQPSAVAGFLSKGVDWLPALLSGDKWASYRGYAQGSGPLPSLTDADGYWFDLKDLFLYGDQFVDRDLTTSDSKVALPTTAGLKRYATLQEAKDLFVDATNDVLTRVRQDGICSLMIATRIRDQIGPTT